MKAFRFDGDNGENIVEGPIPADLRERGRRRPARRCSTPLSMFSDELTEAILEDRVTTELIRAAIRKGDDRAEAARRCCMGSAYKNKAVQLLLDGVIDYLPDPHRRGQRGRRSRQGRGEGRRSPSTPTSRLVALAFKLEDGRYGQLTYLRVYQGTLSRDMFITNMRTGKHHKVGRLVRMHADEMEDIDAAGAGDIVAMFGVECNSGDTFTDGTVKLNMTSMHVPDPVISLSIKPMDEKSENNMSKALRRFTKRGPDLPRGRRSRTAARPSSAGMGELHLDVYVERMKREYDAVVEVSPPQVAYRETVSQRAEFNYTHKKQTGGSGQYGRVCGYIEPCEQNFEFVDDVVGRLDPARVHLRGREGLPLHDREGRGC